MFAPKVAFPIGTYHAFVAYHNLFRQRVNIEYSVLQPITAGYLTDIMGRYTLDLTAHPQATYLPTLVTQDGHRQTVRILKQSEIFGHNPTLP